MTTHTDPDTAASPVARTPHPFGPALGRAVSALAAGGMVVVCDDADREDEGDLVLGATTATTEQLAFVVRHTTGIVCAPMTAARADALALPPMVPPDRNTDAHATAFTVSVDHRDTGTGVSAAARASTLRALADPRTTPGELRRPGHVFPLRARDGGVLERPGHTEATVDLLRLAGREPVGVIGEIVADDGSMARGAGLRAFAARHGLPLVTIADLVAHRLATGTPAAPTGRTAATGTPLPVDRLAETTLPTPHGTFRALVYRDHDEGQDHLVLVHGNPGDGPGGGPPLVRVHSECLTGDVLGSQRCDCGSQLDRSLQAIAAHPAGVLIYLRGHEGRGIGLAAKIRAYALQDTGLDTVEANLAQGLPVDARDFDAAAHILRDLGVTDLRLITNNPAKRAALDARGLVVRERVALAPMLTDHNRTYLRTKLDRLGHAIVLDHRTGVLS